MADLQMGPIESRYADIIWENEPITTAELVTRSEEAFSWKKTTTYTVLKRLCEKGIFQTVKGTVTSLMSRQEFYSVQSENFVNDTFDGSLPAFFAAFTARKSLTPEEIAKLKQMIDSYGEGK
ncbi:MAG: BlaI/MecI/CopY family transcriptional regulator [Lachnospiraceae bacterium]|nr:BlaI/MecI/CopY family transcriptional regulator [Lachnospiraceae bacterium]